MENRIPDSFRFGMQLPFEISTVKAPDQTPATPAASISELYAAAWAKAQQDYELDRLFNAEFYYEI